MADLNLNGYLLPNDTPITQDRGYVNNIEFDQRYQSLPLGNINYTNLAAASRTYTAIISLARLQGVYNDFQEAFNYVNSQGGGRILVLPGQYTISKELTMYANTSIEGVARNNCIIDFNNTVNNLTLNSGAQNLKITDLTIQNCQDTTNGAINSNNNQMVTIERCNFAQNRSGTSGYDIYVAGGSGRVYIRDCLSGTPAIFLYRDQAGNTSEIANNVIQTPQSYAFQGGTTGNGGGQSTYSNNVVFDPNLSAFFGVFSDGRIINNTVARSAGTTTQVLMDFANSGELRITNNYINGQGLAQAAIRFGTCNRFFLANNSIFGSINNTACITITASNNGAIVGNWINTDGGTQDGVNIATSRGITITGNSINVPQAGGYAVNIAATGTETVIVGNYLSGAAGDVNNLGTLTVNANNA